MHPASRLLVFPVVRDSERGGSRPSFLRCLIGVRWWAEFSLCLQIYSTGVDIALAPGYGKLFDELSPLSSTMLKESGIRRARLLFIFRSKPFGRPNSGLFRKSRWWTSHQLGSSAILTRSSTAICRNVFAISSDIGLVYQNIATRPGKKGFLSRAFSHSARLRLTLRKSSYSIPVLS